MGSGGERISPIHYIMDGQVWHLYGARQIYDISLDEFMVFLRVIHYMKTA